MRLAPLVILCLALALSACSGVSTGVRSPCFVPDGGTVTRSAGFAIRSAPETLAERGPVHDCAFQVL